MSIIISAKRHNWGLMSINTKWHKMSFDVTSSAELTVRIYRFQQVFVSKTKVGSEDFEEITRLLELLLKNRPLKRIDGCDGEAWSFTVYDNNRKILFERELGYTSGIDELERLEAILISYISDDLNGSSNAFLG